MCETDDYKNLKLAQELENEISAGKIIHNYIIVNNARTYYTKYGRITISEMAKYANVNRQAISNRLARGLPMDAVLSTRFARPARKKQTAKRYSTPKGRLTVKQIAKLANVSIHAIYARLKSGVRGANLIANNYGGSGGDPKLYMTPRGMLSVVEISSLANVSIHAIYARLDRGLFGEQLISSRMSPTGRLTDQAKLKMEVDRKLHEAEKLEIENMDFSHIKCVGGWLTIEDPK